MSDARDVAVLELLWDRISANGWEADPPTEALRVLRAAAEISRASPITHNVIAAFFVWSVVRGGSKELALEDTLAAIRSFPWESWIELVKIVRDANPTKFIPS